MSKSRNEKKPPVQQAPVHVAITNDIVPGKFNENQWNFVVEQENSQEFILDLVDTIVDCSVKVIYDKYIESQLKPYSVKSAKNLLLQIIESRFLPHDEGEKFPDNYWCEDEEPVPCVTDSWSQGSIPVKRCPSRPLSARSETTNEDHVIQESESSQLRLGEDEESEESNDSNQVDDESHDGVSVERHSLEPNMSFSTEILPSPPTTPKGSVSSPNGRRRTGGQTQERKRKEQRTKKNYQPNDENENCVPTANNSRVESMPVSVSQKVRKGRPPGEAEVTYDEHGNVIAMMRLSVDKLPSHRVRTKYNVIDSDADLLTSRKVSKKITTKESVLNQLRDSRGSNSIINIKKRHEKQTFKNSFKSNYSSELQGDELVKNLPPPLADSVNISAGVVIREGQVVRKGPEMLLVPRFLYSVCDGGLSINSVAAILCMLHEAPKHQHAQYIRQPTTKLHQEITNLHPVSSLANRQSINVSDVIGNTSPVIRPIRLPDPIPPIAPYHHS